jgi:hypothetical protein
MRLGVRLCLAQSCIKLVGSALSSLQLCKRQWLAWGSRAVNRLTKAYTVISPAGMMAGEVMDIGPWLSIGGRVDRDSLRRIRQKHAEPRQN